MITYTGAENPAASSSTNATVGDSAESQPWELYVGTWKAGGGGGGAKRDMAALVGPDSPGLAVVATDDGFVQCTIDDVAGGGDTKKGKTTVGGFEGAYTIRRKRRAAAPTGFRKKFNGLHTFQSEMEGQFSQLQELARKLVRDFRACNGRGLEVVDEVRELQACVEERLLGGVQRDETERRIVLIGPTGGGKSSLLNSLLGEQIARTGGSGSAVTVAPCEFYYWTGDATPGWNEPGHYRFLPSALSGRAGGSQHRKIEYTGETGSALPCCQNSGAHGGSQALLEALSARRPSGAERSMARYKVTLQFFDLEDWFAYVECELTDLLEKKGKSKSALIKKVYENEATIDALQEKWLLQAQQLEKRLEKVDGKWFKDSALFSSSTMLEELKKAHSELVASPSMQPASSSTASPVYRLNDDEDGAERVDGVQASGAARGLGVESLCLKKPYEMIGHKWGDILWSLEALQRLEKRFKEVLGKIEVGSDFALLRVPGFEPGAVRLCDVPGFGDVSAVREKTASRCLEDAHKILICVESSRAGSNKQVREYLEKDAVRALQMRNAGCHNMIFVATKSDQAKLSEISNADGENSDGAPDSDSDSDDDEAKWKKRQAHQNAVKRKIKQMLEGAHFPATTPINIVSSERYLAVKGVKADESSAPDMNEELSGIPELARILLESLFSEVEKRQGLALELLLQQRSALEEGIVIERLRGQGVDMQEIIDRAFAEEDREMDAAVADQIGHERVSHALQKLQQEIDPAGQTAHNRVRQTVQSWGRFHWQTYTATLRNRGRYHSRAAGLVDFCEDLVRPFRDQIHASWMDFFDAIDVFLHPELRTEGDGEQNEQELENEAADYRDRIISRVCEALQNHPLTDIPDNRNKEELRSEFINEVRERGNTLDEAPRFLQQQEVLVHQIRAAQHTIDKPAAVIRNEFGDRYGRRQDRVAELFENWQGFQPGGNVLADVHAALRDINDAVCDFDSARNADRRTAFRQRLLRGSWAVDPVDKCWICHAEPHEIKEWVISDRCAHRWCSDCYAESALCPVCRDRGGTYVRYSLGNALFLDLEKFRKTVENLFEKQKVR